MLGVEATNEEYEKKKSYGATFANLVSLRLYLLDKIQSEKIGGAVFDDNINESLPRLEWVEEIHACF